MNLSKQQVFCIGYGTVMFVLAGILFGLCMFDSPPDTVTVAQPIYELRPERVQVEGADVCR